MIAVSGINLFAQQPVSEIIAPPNSRESVLKIKINDAPNDYFGVENFTLSSRQFMPLIRGHHQSSNRASLSFLASVAPSNDVDNGNPLIVFDARVYNGSSFGRVNRRNLFAWNSHTSALMTMSTEGFLGIGTREPEAKLQIADGDVYIEDINHGVIMKSPDQTCYRITVENGGTLSTTEIDCPN